MSAYSQCFSVPPFSFPRSSADHSLIAAYLCVLPRVPATGLLSAFTLPERVPVRCSSPGFFLPDSVLHSLTAPVRVAFICATDVFFTLAPWHPVWLFLTAGPLCFRRFAWWSATIRRNIFHIIVLIPGIFLRNMVLMRPPCFRSRGSRSVPTFRPGQIPILVRPPSNCWNVADSLTLSPVHPVSFALSSSIRTALGVRHCPGQNCRA